MVLQKRVNMKKFSCLVFLLLILCVGSVFLIGSYSLSTPAEPTPTEPPATEQTLIHISATSVPPTQLHPDAYGTITKANVNLRQGRSTESNVLAVLHSGDVVEIIECGRWVFVSLQNGTVGYISNELMKGCE